MSDKDRQAQVNFWLMFSWVVSFFLALVISRYFAILGVILLFLDYIYCCLLYGDQNRFESTDEKIARLHLMAQDPHKHR